MEIIKRNNILSFTLDLIVRFSMLPLVLLAWGIPKSNNIWAFGAWAGEKYSDNSRYLFEYIKDHINDINPYWLTKSKDDYCNLKAKGFNVHLINSLSGYLICARARVVICSNGIDDVNKYAIARAVKVNLWHGIPLKKIELDHYFHKEFNYGSFKRILFSFLNNKYLFPYINIRWNYSISTSDTIRERMASALGLPHYNIGVTGYPRNDILTLGKDSNLNKLSKTLVIYAPTYRPNIESNLKLFDDIFNKEFINFLVENDIEFHIKLHPIISNHNWIKTKYNNKNIKILSDLGGADINSILHKYDVLISDFSGIIFDYLLLDRPIILFSPDLEDYIADRGLYEDYSGLNVGPIATTWAEVVNFIIKNKSNDFFAETRKKTKNRYQKFSDSNNSMRVYNFIIQRMKDIT